MMIENAGIQNAGIKTELAMGSRRKREVSDPNGVDIIQ